MLFRALRRREPQLGCRPAAGIRKPSGMGCHGAARLPGWPALAKAVPVKRRLASRAWGRWAGWVPALGALLVLGCQPASNPPNVLVIVLDTTRADALTGLGMSVRPTPRLDALAAEGVRYTAAFSTAFWTLPSHASLLTGLTPSAHGATSETNHLPKAATTLAERLRDEGWRTGAFITNAWISRARGFAQGFDRFFEAWKSESRGGDTYTLDRAVVTAAVEWLDAPAADEPFFMLLNLNSVHMPYSPDPLTHVELFPDPRPVDRVATLKQLKGMWGHLGGALTLDDQDYQIMRELYVAELARLDALLGELIDALAQRSLVDDTLIIVTSDHGENIGDHGMIDHLFSMYDSTIRIPLIVRYPGGVRAGETDARLASLIDIVPTVLEVVGLEPAGSSGDARSLLSVEDEPRAFVVAENDRPINGIELMGGRFPDFDVSSIDHRTRALRTRTHKLIWTDDGRVELYDLEADPGELHDLASSAPEMREQLLALLEEWRRANEGIERDGSGPRRERDPDAEAELRALGYIE